MKPQALLTTIATLLMAPAALFAGDAAAIKAPLHGTGDADATGLIVAVLNNQKSELNLQVRKLAPSHTFDIEVAGIVEGTLTTDKYGKASARFRRPAQQNSRLLDFDPRGAAVRLLDGVTSVLEGVVSGPGEDRGTVVDEKVELEHGGVVPQALAKTRLSVNSKGRRTFNVNVAGVTASSVSVYIDGVEHGQIELKHKSGSLVFDSAPRNSTTPLLDFDPRSATIDLVSDDNLLFSGKFRAKVRGVSVATPSAARVALTSTQADADASASARLRIDERARKHFSVEVEDLAAGDYELLVDDAVAGTIHVVATAGGTEGEIEFETGGDDNHELPLTFDPVGKTLTVRQGATVFFESAFNPDLNPKGAPAPEPVSDLREGLTSTGLDADASGKARYRVDDQGRHRFNVEIEDVPVGTYSLKVAGVVRGSIKVVAVTGGTQGEVEFAAGSHHATRESESGGGKGGSGGGGTDDPAGDDHGGSTGGGGTDDPAGDDHGTDDDFAGPKLPLTFDPRGQTIEISSEAGLFFSHLLGEGSAGDPGTPVETADLEVALFRSETLPAGKAKAEFRQREDGRTSFEVEAEGIAAGSYDVTVAGVIKGTLTVTSGERGLRGKLEFESDDSGHPLNFEVLGQVIGLEQNGTVLFSRTFPSL